MTRRDEERSRIDKQNEVLGKLSKLAVGVLLTIVAAVLAHEAFTARELHQIIESHMHGGYGSGDACEETAPPLDKCKKLVDFFSATTNDARAGCCFSAKFNKISAMRSFLGSVEGGYRKTNNNVIRGEEVVACLPTGVVIGTMKGGTGELIHWLNLNPRIRLSSRELRYFTGDLSAEMSTRLRRKSLTGTCGTGAPYDWKQAYLLPVKSFWMTKQQYKHGVVTMEKSPLYTGRYCESAPTMHKLLPRARLVMILRNPTDRAYSAFMHHCSAKRNYTFMSEDGKVTVKARPPCTSEGFDAVLRYYFAKSYSEDRSVGRLIGEFKREALAGNGTGCFDQEYWLHDPRTLARSIYSVPLMYFLHFYPRDQLLVVTNDQMIQDPYGLMGAIEDHVGVPRHDYHKDTRVLPNGKTVIKGVEWSKAQHKYEPMSAWARAKLGEFYAADMAEMKRMFPELNETFDRWIADNTGSKDLLKVGDADQK